MGKRRSKQKIQKKIKPKVPTVFDCPFCNHSQVIECKINKKKMEGKVFCRICDATFSQITNPLTAPVDIYSAWIDECHKQNNIDPEKEDAENHEQGQSEANELKVVEEESHSSDRDFE